MSPKVIQLHEMIDRSMVVDLKATTKIEAIDELCGLISGNPRILDPKAFHEAILKREELYSTGVGLGVAIPHVKIAEVTDYVICIGRRSEGIEFDSLDSQPVRLMFMIGASDKQTRDFIQVLARVMRLLKNGETRVKLLEAGMPDEFLEVIAQDDRNQAQA